MSKTKAEAKARSATETAQMAWIVAFAAEAAWHAVRASVWADASELGTAIAASMAEKTEAKAKAEAVAAWEKAMKAETKANAARSAVGWP